MKKYVALLISITPLNILRITLYNMLMGYKISYSSNIGIGTVIVTHSAIINGASMGKFNTYIGEFDLIVDKGTNIGNTNEFVCTRGCAGSAYCKIGKNVHITNKHFFDTSGGITIKDYTRIAGRGSQFWTHGGQRKQKEIVINEKCYVGSAVRISQGVEISENTFIGLGSVVVDTFNEPNVLIFGHPAKIVKENIIARKSLENKNI
jgi:acetyltransferase-like isoleucine patch superfamily enzyme